MRSGVCDSRARVSRRAPEPRSGVRGLIPSSGVRGRRSSWTRGLHLAEDFGGRRPPPFSVAYRMVGSVAEAEDIVQESFLRYHRALLENHAEIESPKAYLSAIATRLAIDHLRSARVRKESYVGEWLPEPLLTDESAPDPAKH